MAYGDFILDLHPDKLCIYVGGGVNEESIKKALRAASYHRRTMVREKTAAWMSYLVLELRKLSKLCEISARAAKLDQGLEITIAKTRDKLHLRIVDREKYIQNDPFGGVIFDGSFFAFLGNSESRRTGNKRTNKLTRQGRLDWYREKYFEKHGYYPHQETPDSPKKYSPLQAKLNKQHKTKLRKVHRIKETIESGKKRKELVKKLGVRFSKFNIKDHYQEPPKSAKEDE